MHKNLKSLLVEIITSEKPNKRISIKKIDKSKYNVFKISQNLIVSLKINNYHFWSKKLVQ